MYVRNYWTVNSGAGNFHAELLDRARPWLQTPVCASLCYRQALQTDVSRPMRLDPGSCAEGRLKQLLATGGEIC